MVIADKISTVLERFMTVTNNFVAMPAVAAWLLDPNNVQVGASTCAAAQRPGALLR